MEIPAGPEEVLTRVLREQGHWDEDLLESRTVETLDERTEVYQYVRNTMAPHPTRDHLVIRYVLLLLSLSSSPPLLVFILFKVLLEFHFSLFPSVFSQNMGN